MAKLKRREREQPTWVENLLPETATPSSLGAIPGRSRLRAAARRLGGAIGEAAADVRRLRRGLQNVSRETRAVKEQIRARAEEAKDNIAEVTQKGALQAKWRVRRARRQMTRYCQQNPLQVISAVAGVAFIGGVALRMWRSRG